MRPLSELPNTVGFRFVGITQDGRRIDCHVVRNPDGNHRVATVLDDSLVFHALQGWEPVEVCPDPEMYAGHRRAAADL